MDAYMRDDAGRVFDERVEGCAAVDVRKKRFLWSTVARLLPYGGFIFTDALFPFVRIWMRVGMRICVAQLDIAHRTSTLPVQCTEFFLFSSRSCAPVPA